LRIAVDTNVLVRYLTCDDESQATEASRAIEGAKTVVIATLVLCELVWVLKRRYRYSHQDIGAALRLLLQGRSVECDQPAISAGLAFLERGGDFADGVVHYEAQRARCDSLVTFDRDLFDRAASGTVALLGAG
jgi:predicted nucleic-acid-binding protein